MEHTAILCRYKRSDQGTRGMLYCGSFNCHTLELPWKNNQKSISCIPPGEYDVKIRLSPKYGKVYHVQNVPGRSYILIHYGNWAGDINKGFKSNVNGCILLGAERGLLQNQWAVLNSRITIRKFMDYMNNEEFKLIILDSFGDN